MAQVTWDEMFAVADDYRDVPDWFVQIVQSVKVADNLGDVWNALIGYAPAEAKEWVKAVAWAEYDSDTERYTFNE